jgi:hypothetical protein
MGVDLQHRPFDRIPTYHKTCQETGFHRRFIDNGTIICGTQLEGDCSGVEALVLDIVDGRKEFRPNNLPGESPGRRQQQEDQEKSQHAAPLRFLPKTDGCGKGLPVESAGTEDENRIHGQENDF